MAIAGGTKPAFFLYLDKGELRMIGNNHRPAAHIVVVDVEKAVRQLRAGESIYFWQYGGLEQLKAALGVQP